jgi:hypothetical protein
MYSYLNCSPEQDPRQIYKLHGQPNAVSRVVPVCNHRKCLPHFSEIGYESSHPWYHQICVLPNTMLMPSIAPAIQLPTATVRLCELVHFGCSYTSHGELYRTCKVLIAQIVVYDSLTTQLRAVDTSGWYRKRQRLWRKQVSRGPDDRWRSE